ncbi:MAG: paraquat-inducible protein A [Salaquimonas sp.]|jgi:paraquat-inducible protein A|nr:paraquat-inducible protein A [Salaquimonas sp.]
MPALRPVLLLLAAISFGLGISLPLIRLEKLYFFTETPSLIGVVAGLWNGGDIALAGLVAAFSLVFPVVKMATVYEAAFGSGRFPAWAGVLSKWSMMDVLLVAILIFAAKTSGLASAVSQPGIWFYGVSTVLTAFAAGGISRAKA